MKNKIQNIDTTTAGGILKDFAAIYFDKGFGLMNKTEIETLLYHVLYSNGLLKGSCFEDSLLLKIPESRVRRLIYDSKVKYTSNDPKDVDTTIRKYLGNLLQSSHFVIEKNKICFSIEDRFVRVALNAKLRQNDYFADTSFNRDIVVMDVDTFSKVVSLLIPNYEQNEVLTNYAEQVQISKEREGKDSMTWLKAIIKDIFVKTSAATLIKLGEVILKASVVIV